MRLIDAHALAETLAQLGHSRFPLESARDDGYVDAIDDVLDEVAKAPTVDSVPVVRCKDCINAVPHGCDKYVVCLSLCCVRLANGFCDNGEKKQS